MGNMIVMPWPVPQVWPNYRQSHHWRSYYKPVKAQRDLACLMANAAKFAPVWNDAGTHIAMTITISPPDKRRRDRDGMKGACKSILDGIADAIGVDDQYFDPIFVFAEPKKPGQIIVEMGVATA